MVLVSWSSTVDHTRIRTVVTEVRKILFDELERQLDRYGLLDSDPARYAELTYLSAEERATRRQLERALYQEAAGFDTESESRRIGFGPSADQTPVEALTSADQYERTFENYVEESAQAMLTRLLGLLVLEERDIIEHSVVSKPDEGTESYVQIQLEDIAGELTTSRDLGYPTSLLITEQNLAESVPAVYGESRYTILRPDRAVVQDIMSQLRRLGEGETNHFEIDELFGWVYQYFGEEKRNELADEVNNEDHKLAGGELATSSQKFTPRYIVEWLVDNSLGRLWYESTPDTGETLQSAEYLAPHDDGLQSREEVDPKAVSVFDPACGGGHVLLYAVELLQDWYHEYYPSYSEREIVECILEQNIHGVDLDSGAAQLATLALFTKAKTAAADASIDQINVFGTGGIEFTDDQVAALRSAAGESTVPQTLIDRTIREFHELSSKGSLVRIRNQIDEVLDEMEGLEDVPGSEAQLTTGGTDAPNRLVIDGETYDRSEIEDELFEGLRDCVDEALDTDVFDPMHRSEIGSGIDLLDVLTDTYDAVITNPPYLVSNKMDSELKAALKSEFEGSRDIYAAFIERNLEYVSETGYVAMITMETFMFQYVFHNFRPWFLDRARFVDTAHIRNRDEGYMDVAFVFEQFDDSDTERQSQFARLVDVDEPDRNKREELQETVKEIRDASDAVALPEHVSRVDQQRFHDIPRTRFLYWFGEEILELFAAHPTLADEVELKVGLQTGDDDRFIRNWWELPPSARPAYPLGGNADRYGSSTADTPYRWFSQSGDDNEFLDPTTKLVRWGEDGDAIRSADSKAYVRNEQFYGQGGVTFRLFSSYLTARIQPEGHFFGHTAHFGRARQSDVNVTERSEQDDVLLGYLNSSLARFVIDGFNPGLRYEVGDASNLPWIGFDSFDESDHLAALARRAVEVQIRRFRLDETRPTFDPTSFLERVDSLQYERDLARADIASIDGLIDDVVFDAFDISERTREKAIQSGDIPPTVHGLPHLAMAGTLPEPNSLPQREIEVETASDASLASIETRIQRADSTDVRELAAELGVSPQTVAMVRAEADLYDDDERADVAARLVSFCVGVAFGRWQLPDDVTVEGELLERLQQIRENGAVATVESPPDEPTLAEIVLELLELLKTRTGLSRLDVEDRLGKSVTAWLDEDYFADFLCRQYRGRGERSPIYIQVGGPEAERTWYLYYHALDDQMLERLLTHVDQALVSAKSERDSIRDALDSDSTGTQETERELARVEDVIADMEGFRDGLKTASPEFEVDPEAGIDEALKFLDGDGILAVSKEKL